MNEYPINLIGFIFSCVVSIITAFCSYFKLFFKVKYDIGVLREAHENLKESVREDKLLLGRRLDSIEKKNDDNTKLIINTIMNKSTKN